MIGKFKKWWNEHMVRRHWFLVSFTTKSLCGESKSFCSFNKTKSRKFTFKDIRDVEGVCENFAKKNGHIDPAVVIVNIMYLGKMSINTWNGKD